MHSLDVSERHTGQVLLKSCVILEGTPSFSGAKIVFGLLPTSTCFILYKVYVMSIHVLFSSVLEVGSRYRLRSLLQLASNWPGYFLENRPPPLRADVRGDHPGERGPSQTE